jgi:hypothetical protein
VIADCTSVQDRDPLLLTSRVLVKHERRREHRDDPENGWSNGGTSAHRFPYQNFMMKWAAM